MAELPKDVWKGVRKERERRAGLNEGEVGKSWNDTFAPEAPASAPNNEKFFKKDPKRGGKPPADLIKKHESERYD